MRVHDQKLVGALELQHYYRFLDEGGLVEPDPVLQGIVDTVASAGFLSLREAVAAGATFVIKNTGGSLIEKLAQKAGLKPEPAKVAVDESLGKDPEESDLIYLRETDGKYDYAGRTNSLKNRGRQHGAPLHQLDDLPGLSRAQARSVEEALIARGKGQPLNYTNDKHSIDPKLEGYELTVAYGETLLAETGYAP